jgi:hypothetical protein
MQTLTENQTLILSGSGYELQIAPEAQAEKATLLKHSALIVTVADAPSAEAARLQVKKLAAMRNLVEKSRKLVKEPVLEVGRDIDAKAKDFVAEIDAEERRVSGLIANHAAEVQRAAEAAARERQRIERERIAAEQEAARAAAESARIEAERIAKEQAAAAPADEFSDEAVHEEAVKIAARMQEELARAKAADLERQQREAATLAQATVAGVKWKYDFEVVNINALADARLDLVTIEPKRREILAAIQQVADAGGEPELPGCIIKKTAVVSTR